MDWNTPQRLLITSRPKAGESFTGYILRLTELNHYDKPSWILKEAGASASTLWVNKRCSFVFDRAADWGRLSAVTGVSVEKLMGLAYPPAGEPNTALVCGQPVPQYLIRIFKPKVCPECLRQTGYCRTAWDLAFVTVCSAHRCLLLDECPNCRKPLSLLRSRVCVCRCGFDWREAAPTPVADSELKLARHVYRLLGLPMGNRPGSELEEPLRGLSLEGLLSSIFFILGQQRGMLDTKGKRTAPFSRNAKIHRSLNDAVAVFEGWPERFFSFLDWRRRQGFKNAYGCKSATGVQKEFGTFHEGLHRQLTASAYDYLRNAYKEYLETRWDGGVMRAHLVRNASSDRSKYVSRTEARKFLGMDHEWVIRFIKTGKLKGIIQQRKHSRLILIERESLAALKRMLDESISTQEVADRLGIGDMPVRDLVRCGCLVPLRGPEIDGFATRWFTTNAVDDLLGHIRSRINPETFSRGDDVVGWNKAILMLQTLSIKTSGLVQAILGGRLVPCRETTGIGFKRFVFSERVVRDYLQSQSAKQDCFRVPDAAKLMGLSTGSVYNLTKKGFIAAQGMSGQKGKSIFISKESIESFNATYTSLFKLACQNDISFKFLHSLLTANGVVPVSGRSVDGGAQLIFRNDDLRKINIKALLTE